MACALPAPTSGAYQLKFCRNNKEDVPKHWRALRNSDLESLNGITTLPHGTYCQEVKCRQKRYPYPQIDVWSALNQKIACLKGKWYIVEKKWQKFKKIREVNFEEELNCAIGCPMQESELKFWSPHPSLSKPAGEKVMRFEVDGVKYQSPDSKALATCNCGANSNGSFPTCSAEPATTQMVVECRCGEDSCMWEKRKYNSKLRVEHDWGQSLPNKLNQSTMPCSVGSDTWSEWSECSSQFGGVRKRMRACEAVDEAGNTVIVDSINCDPNELIEWQRCGTPSKWPDETVVRARSHWDFPMGVQQFSYGEDHPQATKQDGYQKSDNLAAVIDGLSATTEPKCKDFKDDGSGLYYTDQSDVDYYDTYYNYWWRCASYACTYGTGENASGSDRGDYFRFDLGQKADIGGLGVDVGNLLSVIGSDIFNLRLIVTKEAKGKQYPDESFKGYFDCGYIHEKESLTGSAEMYETPQVHFSCPEGTRGQYLWLIQDQTGHRLCLEEVHLFSSL